MKFLYNGHFNKDKFLIKREFGKYHKALLNANLKSKNFINNYIIEYNNTIILNNLAINNDFHISAAFFTKIKNQYSTFFVNLNPEMYSKHKKLIVKEHSATLLRNPNWDQIAQINITNIENITFTCSHANKLSPDKYKITSCFKNKLKMLNLSIFKIDNTIIKCCTLKLYVNGQTDMYIDSFVGIMENREVIKMIMNSNILKLNIKKLDICPRSSKGNFNDFNLTKLTQLSIQSNDCECTLVDDYFTNGVQLKQIKHVNLGNFINLNNFNTFPNLKNLSITLPIIWKYDLLENIAKTKIEMLTLQILSRQGGLSNHDLLLLSNLITLKYLKLNFDIYDIDVMDEHSHLEINDKKKEVLHFRNVILFDNSEKKMCINIDFSLIPSIEIMYIAFHTRVDFYLSELSIESLNGKHSNLQKINITNKLHTVNLPKWKNSQTYVYNKSSIDRAAHTFFKIIIKSSCKWTKIKRNISKLSNALKEKINTIIR